MIILIKKILFKLNFIKKIELEIIIKYNIIKDNID